MIGVAPGVQNPRPLPRYRNEFRWRVMPGQVAAADGYFDRGFGSKAKALAYQKLVKTLFPEETCCLCDTGRYYDADGHSFDSRA